MVHVNLSDVGSEDFEVLPAGAYNATLIDARLVTQEDKPDKFPYINWEFKLDDKPGKAWAITSLSPKALWKLREALDAFGEDTDILDDDEGFDLDETDYIGAEVVLVLTIGTTDRGKERNEVESILPPDSVEPAPKTKAKADPRKKKGTAKRRTRRKAV